MYADLVLRSAPAKDSRYNQLIDKVTLTEFTQLPGILSDRFNALCGSNPKAQEARVPSEKFLSTLTAVYSSTLEEKMKLCFDVYDFDQDGKINAEDVRIVLSHIPIKHNTVLSSSLNSKEEGLISKKEAVSEDERQSNSKLIAKFAALVFQ